VKNKWILYKLNQALELIISEVKRASHSKSTGRAPAFGKGDERPSQLIIVRSQRRRIENKRKMRKIGGRNRCDGGPHGIQQSVEFNFAHGCSPCQEPPCQKDFVCTLQRSFKLYRSAGEAGLGYLLLDGDGAELWAQSRQGFNRPALTLSFA
jgi:hypothetical protein